MSNNLPQVTQLPVSGDLWRPPVLTEDGIGHVPRPDTLELGHLPPARGNMSPDQMALLMAENTRLAAENATLAAKGK